MQPSLFIGLVTHPKSRYPSSSGPQGLSTLLAGELRSAGWNVACSIAADDEIDESSLDMSRGAVLASIDAELDAERRWMQFQSSKPLSARDSTVLEARRLFRRWKYARRASRPSMAGRVMLLRLANIESSHLRLLREAQASGARWALILEDDAFTADVTELARALDRQMRQWEHAGQPKFVNMSRSFPLSKLRLRSPLTDVGSWDSSARIFSATIPFTNTVCAILYRGEFLPELNRELDAIPLQPVIPIDWKLNRAIMRLANRGRLHPGDCYIVDPAPILQGSMHRTESERAAG